RARQRPLLVDLPVQRGRVANTLAHVPPVPDDDTETTGDEKTNDEEGHGKPLRERDAKDASAISAHHQQAELLFVVHPSGSPPGERAPRILRGFSHWLVETVNRPSRGDVDRVLRSHVAVIRASDVPRGVANGIKELQM